MAREALVRVLLSALLAVIPFGRAAAQEPPGDDERLREMSLEELLNVSVVSASNTTEKLADAPATVIVLTRADLLQRGYTELSEMLDDLPGMDVVRPYGATYLKNYWRGYRNTIGDPFLLLVDGIVMNHLYFQTADALATFPLSNIERVEVVYGPASSVYGPNAFMGVINVITLKDKAVSGTSFAARLSAGSDQTRIADVSALYKKDDFRLSATARLDNGDLDRGPNEAYEYTKDKYYADRRLWGGFLDNPNLGGSFLSHRKQRSADVRAFFAGLELGFTYDNLNSGYGVEYAGDRAQNNAVWARPEWSLFLRARRTLRRDLVSTTLVRYRRSDVSNDSYFVESVSHTDASGRSTQAARFSFWQALNSSVSVYQDFDLKATERLSFTAGFKYEQKDLQKAYDTVYGPEVPVDRLDASTYPYPTPPVDSSIAQNRITTTDAGVYVQGKWRIATPHQVHLGIRYDRNSSYGGATTFRGGYVGNYGRFGLKALYGEAFQEPNPRLLYGGWKGSGSDPNLSPEKSRTFEVSGTYQEKAYSALLSIYVVKNLDTIINTAAGAQNLGDRLVTGFDVHVQALLKTPPLSQLRLWAFYSRILTADEKRADGSTGRIGDLANDKLTLGATAVLDSHLSTTLRAHLVGPRDTVETNPVSRVGGFFTFDATVAATDLLVRGLGLTLKATNL
ncbi:MAG TPA: TonB-dependent receptor, partial [Thermoanaerobaculia bacterium]|nr:TonB-dependent receptor [Thermoanaerobaculia bacterium]